MSDCGWLAGEFVAYGPSHRVVLVVAVIGAAALPLVGQRIDARSSRWLCRVIAVALVVLNLGSQLWLLGTASRLEHALPFHLSDLAPYTAAVALWSRRRWACALTYYWGLTLTPQALLTPALRGPDFPSVMFLVFFAAHVLVIWSAAYLAWGLRARPGWRGYRFAVAVTVCWAAVMLPFNAHAGTNYGFLNAKPATGSVLDLFGPWPWYLVPEAALVLGTWALLTVRRGREVDRVEAGSKEVTG